MSFTGKMDQRLQKCARDGASPGFCGALQQKDRGVNAATSLDNLLRGGYPSGVSWDRDRAPNVGLDLNWARLRLPLETAEPMPRLAPMARREQSRFLPSPSFFWPVIRFPIVSAKRLNWEMDWRATWSVCQAGKTSSGFPPKTCFHFRRRRRRAAPVGRCRSRPTRAVSSHVDFPTMRRTF
jgi:hypothetical protein